MSDFEPLPPDLAALFAREKESYDEDPALKSRVLSHVEWAVALGGPPGGGGGGDPSGGAAGHGGGGDAPPGMDGGASLAHGGAHAAGAMHAAGAATAAGFGLKTVVAATVSAFVAGGAVGGTVVKTATGVAGETPALHEVAVSAPVPSDFRGAPRPTFIAPPPIATLEEEPSALPPLEPEPAPKPSSNAHVEKAGDITRERELLDAARAALARGRPDDAIAAAERHAQKWPHGYLVEERDAVLIQALALGGRHDEAQRRANAFRKAYPQSILLPAIDASLASP
ncbi:hypothetical protein LZC95_52820 [Pendulispora brunnea]|uniref:Uncharacterized protein n=1 Tax=Pendulispora brunnea TaxID=2905690 RepID=A0ABZ2KE01_9BACT